jgi:hypothetical protein
MKQTVNSSDFVDAFRTHNRMDQFSYEGLKALFEHLEQYEADTGEEMELDVIAICCDYAEYAAATDAATGHGWETDDDDNEEAALEWLQDRTTVIPHKKGIIIQPF